MRLTVTLAIILSAAGMLAAGCTSSDYSRMDGLTFGAGNAMAANTAMQMVDPWPNGVQNTKLLVPAERGAQTSAADTEVAADEAEADD